MILTSVVGLQSIVHYPGKVLNTYKSHQTDWRRRASHSTFPVFPVQLWRQKDGEIHHGQKCGYLEGEISGQILKVSDDKDKSTLGGHMPLKMVLIDPKPKAELNDLKTQHPAYQESICP